MRSDMMARVVPLRQLRQRLQHLSERRGHPTTQSREDLKAEFIEMQLAEI